jgi:hypothetical protein
MNKTLVLIILVSFGCSVRTTREEYAKNFFFVVEELEDDIDVLDQHIESTKREINKTYALDSTTFTSTKRAIEQLNRKCTKLIDSIALAETYYGSSSIKDKTIELAKIYRDEALASYMHSLFDDFNVYGRNTILKLEKPLQDSLNTIILKSNEKSMESLRIVIRERQNFDSYVNAWVEGTLE